MSVPRHDAKAAFACLLFFLSGVAALVYQVAWQRLLALHSGVGIYSVAMIVAAFMAGLGLGSHVGGTLSVRTGPRAALRAFGLLELGIALFGALSCALYYDWLYPKAAGLESPSWKAGLLHLLALMPPTALMGMSLPFLVRAMVRVPQNAGQVIGTLYGVNVLGASLGAILTPWLLIPLWGIRGAVQAAALSNAVAGLGALLLGLFSPARLAFEAGPRFLAFEDGPPPPILKAQQEEQPGARPFALWVALYSLSGFVALSLEILWFRVMDVAVKSTAFTFGTVLAVYLLGLAAGSLLGAGWVSRVGRPLLTFLRLQLGILLYAGVALLLLAALPEATPLYRWFIRYWGEYEGFHLGRTWEIASVLRLYVLLPALLFGPCTVLMGLAFPVLQRAVHDDARTSGRKVGILQAANIAGCVAGSLLVGLVGLSFLGTAGTLRALLACGGVFAGIALRHHGFRFGIALASLGLAIVALALPRNEAFWLRLHGAPAGASMLQEDATSLVALTPEGQGRWRLSVNGKGNSWMPFGSIHTLLGALPALIHPAPREVAIVGLGSGDTAWAAGCRRETHSVSVFEISAPQMDLLRRLAEAVHAPRLDHFLRDGRVRVHVADGRHALEGEGPRYDLIQVDALRPESAYSGNLYSVEFFSRCAARLKPGGVVCTWSPMSRVYATFVRVFPYVLELDDSQILVGSREPLAIDHEAWRTRLQDPAVLSYLGADLAEDVLPRLESGKPAGRRGRRRTDLNYDLFPRDEFAVP